MKGKSGWKAYALTLLCISTAVMLALSSATMCKYAVGGSAAASTRVAKWEVEMESTVPNEPASIPSETGGVLKFRSGGTMTHTFTGIVKIKNLSEVAATPDAKITFTNGNGGFTAGNITAPAGPAYALTRVDSGSLDPVGGAHDTATYNLTITATAGTGDGYITAYITCSAVQVD